MKLCLPATISYSSSPMYPDFWRHQLRKLRNTCSVHVSDLWMIYYNKFIFKNSLNRHIFVILLLSYIHSIQIHSWQYVMKKQKPLHHFPSSHDVSLSSPSMFGNHCSNFCVYDAMVVYLKQSLLMYSQTIFPCLFLWFSSSARSSLPYIIHVLVLPIHII
jgi:hypothetical protein